VGGVSKSKRGRAWSGRIREECNILLFYYSDILDFKQVLWSFVLSHVRLTPLIRRGTRNLKNP